MRKELKSNVEWILIGLEFLFYFENKNKQRPIVHFQ